MKKYIVITSIFDPTEAVIKFSNNTDYHLIVVGDQKTPADWFCKDVDYLSVLKQSNLKFNLIKLLPYNHYCRKMIGYLQAISEGAEIIIDTDDDNIPYSNWSFPEFTGVLNSTNKNLGFINMYQYFTDTKIWPRGLPLQLINEKFNFNEITSFSECNVGIWQGLADEDPDVDAIYRLTDNKPCFFNQKDPIVLKPGTLSPFNSQNTAIIKELFPLLYLPSYVTFRFTDILRSYVAQPIMWLHGYELGFISATVIQKRNPHDYMKDFLSEIPMYQSANFICKIVESAISKESSIEENILNSYIELQRNGIVPIEEIECLKAWLSDLQNLNVKN